MCHILVICTANMCRSPAAAAALRRRLADRDVAATVVSAGRLYDGAPAASGMCAASELVGLDLSDHRSRILSATDVGAADLVIGMAREHVREAAILVPAAWGRSFTLKELVRTGRDAGPRVAGEGLAEWLARAGAGRSYACLSGSSPADDVFDPIGGTEADFATSAREIVALVDDLVALAWPPSLHPG